MRKMMFNTGILYEKTFLFLVVMSTLVSSCENKHTEATIDYLWVYQETIKQNKNLVNRCNDAAQYTLKYGLTEKQAEDNYTYKSGIPHSVDTKYDFKYQLKNNIVQVEAVCWVEGYNRDNIFRDIPFKNEMFTDVYELKIR